MSRFSGKCDFYDSIVMIHEYTLEELQNKVRIYIGGSKIPLHIENMEDLIPYYPYIVIAAYYDNVERKSVMRLSPDSFVDSEEKEILNFYLKQLLKYYNHCKRKKIEFDTENAVNKTCWTLWDKEGYIELANRIKEYGNKATIDGIHLKMQEIYREELVEEMIRKGLNPCKYGYERFMKRKDIKNEDFKE